MKELLSISRLETVNYDYREIKSGILVREIPLKGERWDDLQTFLLDFSIVQLLNPNNPQLLS